MHQPVDNLSEAIDKAVKICYEPFFETVAQFPGFKFAVHCSGWLLEKIERDYPKLFEYMQIVTQRGDIEWVSAGFYEPVLSSIPNRDRKAQIKMLNKTIKKLFSQKPSGAWLTERVWESSVIDSMKRRDIDYTIVDDYHFIASGFDRDRLDGYYTTEEGGEEIALFPISQELRYAIPFMPVNRAIDSIKRVIKSDNGAAILFDDAEKFGMWPHTYKWVYEKGWLKSWLEAVMSDEEIVTMHYRDYLHTHKTKGLAYLPTTSYFEMGEWSLNSDDALTLERYKRELGKEEFEKNGIKLLKGGIWKNFFIKYSESNKIHKRMLELSKNRVKRRDYLDYLYRLQTNDVLWHGVFGGIYLPNLRDNAYRYISECENIRYGKKSKIEIADIDMDGFDEAKVVESEYIARFESANGGQLVEWIDRKSLFNFQNTLTRRREAYHKLITDRDEIEEESSSIEIDEGISTIHNDSKEVSQEIVESLYYDWYIKNSFIDHISNDSLILDSLKKCDFWEYGDFANQPFEMSLKKKNIIFKREGGIYYDEKYPTTIKKIYTPLSNSIDFNISIKTQSPHRYRYGLEFNFHFANYDNLQINGKRFDSSIESDCIDYLEIFDSYTDRVISIKIDNKFTLLIDKLQTVSQNEKGFELTTQGLTIMLVFTLEKELNLNGKLEIKSV